MSRGKYLAREGPGSRLHHNSHGCCGRSTRGWHCFSVFFFSDFADMKMKTCQGLARRHALKRPPFPDTTSEVLASDGQHRSS